MRKKTRYKSRFGGESASPRSKLVLVAVILAIVVIDAYDDAGIHQSRQYSG